MPLREQMPDGVAGGPIVVDAHIRHANRRIEFAAGDPWQRATLGERGLDGGGIEADGASARRPRSRSK